MYFLPYKFNIVCGSYFVSLGLGVFILFMYMKANLTIIRHTLHIILMNLYNLESLNFMLTF